MKKGGNVDCDWVLWGFSFVMSSDGSHYYTNSEGEGKTNSWKRNLTRYISKEDSITNHDSEKSISKKMSQRSTFFLRFLTNTNNDEVVSQWLNQSQWFWWNRSVYKCLENMLSWLCFNEYAFLTVCVILVEFLRMASSLHGWLCFLNRMLLVSTMVFLASLTGG